MKGQLLTSHVKDEGFKRPFLVSLAGHALLMVVVAAAGWLLPQGLAIELGSGPGGGQGSAYIPVEIAASADDGGFGTVKPTLAPAPRSIPPEEPEKPEEPEEPGPDAFKERQPEPKKEKPRPELPEDREPLDPPKPPRARPGDIVRDPDPGTGGEGSPGGAGGGQGTGVGVDVGGGRNDAAGISSYYIRLVEQRVGSNWLATSLGRLGRPVQTVISFTVERNGRISDITLEQPSGINTVDVAAQRAVQASNPLPPLPLEFRGRSVRFRSVFNYPPR